MGTPTTLVRLAAGLAAAPDRARAAVAAAMPACAVAAVAGVRADVYAGRSPDGTPFAPLRFPREAGGDRPLLSTAGMVGGVSSACGPDEITLRANSPQARLMHLGGVVTPTRAKALAIPLTREAARAGSPRHFPRPLFPIKGKRGLFESKGKGKRATLVMHYLFAASVTVPARPWLGFSAAVVDRIKAIVGGKVADATKIKGG